MKIAFVISPQNWGKMHISKHHYAIELSKIGYFVYFVESPIETRFFRVPKIQIVDSEFENLKIVKSHLFFSYYFKFHMPFVHNLLIYIHRELLIKKIGKPSLVLSFDLVNNFPMKGLNCKRIFFAADEPRADKKLKSAEHSDLIVSVSQHIVDFYNLKFPNIKKLVINHGVSEDFFKDFTFELSKYDGINVGLSGNFMFNDIDYITLELIISQNPSVHFHFYGATRLEESNIGADTSINYNHFLLFISKSKNVTIHGVLNKLELSQELNQMDLFLICYNPKKSQSSGSNSHKILEYLSTGRVVVSSNFSRYSGTNLFQMVEFRDNKSLPSLFKSTILQLSKFNSIDNLQKRRRFANSCKYSVLVNEII